MKFIQGLLSLMEKKKVEKVLKEIDDLHFKANEYLRVGKTEEAKVLISRANNLTTKIDSHTK